MPKKGGKKKEKGPAFLTDPDSCEPFGFMANDIIVTPMGLEVTIVGVKKTEGDGSNGTMWAQFQGGYTSPLRPKTPLEFEMQGYRRAHEGLHIWRNKEDFAKKRQELLNSVNPVLLAEERKAKEAKKDDKGKKKKK